MAYIGQKPGSNFRDVSIKDSFTGDGSTVAFDLAKSFSQADVNGIEVFVDNVRQEPTVAYTVGQDGSGNFKRVTFTAAPAASASIYVLNPGVTSGVLSVSDGAVTTAKIGNDAVSEEHLDVTAITGHPELAEAANNADTVLLHDDSAGSLKKIQVSNLTAQAGDGLAKSSSTLSVDANNATTLETSIASGDFVLVYDASAGVLRKVSQTNFLNFPTVSSVSPTNVTSGDGTGNYTIVITGSGFTGATAKLLKSDNSTEVSFDTVTVDSSTQITGVIAKSSLANADEPFGVKISAASGLNSQLNQQITLDAQPIWSTASGSLATVADGSRSGLSYTVAAADPESGGDVTYTLESGSLPSGLSGSSTSSGYVISGDANAVGSDTTSTFTIRAADVNSNTADREFSITISQPTFQVFNSSGTFSVPSGTSSVDVLVVAAGGSGGYGTGTGGGGAGGLIFRPGFPVTPGGTVTVTVGDGGPAPTGGNTNGGSVNGQDSVFGTLTAKGGGGGGNDYGNTGKSGGSGGGGSGPASNSAGSATQPTQSGDSGTYGFGNSGGPGWSGGGYGGGGGGGAGAAGSPQPYNTAAAPGGVGKAYTIADGTTSVYYAGGGTGGNSGQSNSPGGQGGGGGNARGGNLRNPGTANRGGGGGGSNGSGQTGPGGTGDQAGNGGKGVVIVRWS